MSRGLRLLGALGLACATLPVFAVPAAHADSALLVPSNSGYFFAAGVDKPDASPAAPPNLGTDVDGVAAGHLAVAAKGGKEEKVSFLYFDVFNLPAGAVVDKAVVRMVLVPNAPPTDISFQAAPANVIACMAGDQGFNGDDAVGLAKAPSRLCDKFKAPAKLSSDGKSYEFDITGLASTWIDGANDGVAFTAADTAPSSNFQVVFDAAPTASMDVSYTAPPAETPVDTPVTTVPGGSVGGVVTPPDAGGGFAPQPSTGFGQVPDAVVPPTTDTGLPPVTTPGQAPARKVAALSTSMRPTNTFWLGGLALLIALAVISLVCGDPRVAAGRQQNSRLSKALSARQGLVARPVAL